MEDQSKNIEKGTIPPAAPKKPATPGKLPSKPISFANQSKIKNGKTVKTAIDKSKKSNHLMKKLTGK